MQRASDPTNVRAACEHLAALQTVLRERKVSAYAEAGFGGKTFRDRLLDLRSQIDRYLAGA